MCQVTKSNDVLKNNIHFPIAYGFGYNLKNKRAFMCNKFLDKGPDSNVRSARHFTDNNVRLIFNFISFFFK